MWVLCGGQLMRKKSPPQRNTFDPERFKAYHEARQQRQRLENQAKQNRCRVCRGRLTVAYIGGQDRLRCLCFPNDPVIMRHSARDSDNERRNQMARRRTLD